MVNKKNKQNSKNRQIYKSQPLDKVETNRLKRVHKKVRERERKEKGTFVSSRAKPGLNKWGKPFYQLKREEIVWRKRVSSSGSYVVWFHPITKQTLYGLPSSVDPAPYIHYTWEATCPKADIKAVYVHPKLLKIENAKSGLTMPVFNK